MASSPVARAVGSRMSKLSAELGAATRTAVERGAFEAKRTIAAEIRRASGGDNRLSKVGSQPGAKVGVRYDIKGEINPTALVRATGPVHLLEHVSKAHLIIPKKTGRGSKGRGSRRENKQALYDALFGNQWAGVKPLKTPYGPRFRVQHPGVKQPKKPFETGFKKAEPRVRREVGSVTRSAFARGATK